MRMVDIILKKRDGGELQSSEIDFWINGYVEGSIPDYQSAALLMAIYFQGLNPEETTALTLAMLQSGARANLTQIPGIKIDKHSTGGVGDKTTLVLGPLVASAGVSIAKMSGRGLGHTGGTIDKLESIPGFSSAMNESDFIRQVREMGLAVSAQTLHLVPADKKMYALRDVTATVDNLSLIASSIMSKKMASGADAIVLDVKAGQGAFMKNTTDAKALANLMVDIGTRLQRRTVAFITNMDQPLGMAVGNALEVQEAIDTLRGGGPPDLRELCLTLGAEMLILAGKTNHVDAAVSRLKQHLDNGKALALFEKMIASQKGDPRVLTNPELLPKAQKIKRVEATSQGYIHRCDALYIGQAAMNLGAGRKTKDSSIDLAAGVLLHKKIGDPVKKGETLATLHYNWDLGLETAQELVKDAFQIGKNPIKPNSLIIDKISYQL